MRRRPQPIQDAAYRAGAGMVGGLLLASAAMAADLARDHMVALGTLCGVAPAPHCGWCLSSAGLAAMALVAFAVALLPGRRLLSGAS